MKNLALTTIIIIFLSGCMSFNDYVVDSDYSYLGDFKNYKSFCFQNELNPDLKNQPIKLAIEKEIKSRMELQGYRFDKDQPNIYVAYRMFYKDVELKGYKQPLLEDWLKYQDQDLKYDPIEMDLKKGTLLVLFRDREYENTVWQGYASTLLGNENCDNDRYVKNIVRSIFDQYRIFANNLVAENRY